jgi:hypothetical protein
MKINWRIFAMSQIFWLLETAHFGWNFLPATDAEMICDGIVILLMALSVLQTSQPSLSRGP